MRAVSATSRSDRATKKAARALTATLRMFRLKVTTGAKAGGICPGFNRNRRVMVAR